MRILQVHTRYRQRGGEDVVVEAEAELLRSAGHEVIRYETVNPDGVLKTVAPMLLSPWNPFAAGEVEAFVGQHHPDVVHVHNTWFSLSPSVLAACRKLGVPVVMTLHNYRLTCANSLLFRDGRPCEDCVGTHPWRGVLHRCYRDSAVSSAAAAATISLNRRRDTWLRNVNLFLALTEFARSRFIEAGLPAERIRVKGNFVTDPGPRINDVASSDTVLFVGRLSSEKGLGVLIDSWARLGHTRLKLLVAGDGPVRRELERDLPRGVRFIGTQSREEVIRHMLAARLLVVPSVWYEGHPVVILEAMSAGLPVLASDIGALSEMVEPLGPDWLFSPGDAAGLAESLGRCEDESLVSRGGEIARRLYEQIHNQSVALDSLERIYVEALASGP